MGFFLHLLELSFLDRHNISLYRYHEFYARCSFWTVCCIRYFHGHHIMFAAKCKWMDMIKTRSLRKEK